MTTAKSKPSREHERLSVGTLAQRSGLTGSTIRYYERIGLITPDGRTTGNYRYFTGETLERLQFVRAAQASGLSLEDVRALLEFRDGVVAPCPEVKAVIEARLGDVTRQMKHLRHLQTLLKGYAAACEKTGPGAPCPVLIKLTPGTPRRRAKSRS